MIEGKRVINRGEGGGSYRIVGEHEGVIGDGKGMRGV